MAAAALNSSTHAMCYRRLVLEVSCLTRSLPESARSKQSSLLTFVETELHLDCPGARQCAANNCSLLDHSFREPPRQPKWLFSMSVPFRGTSSRQPHEDALCLCFFGSTDLTFCVCSTEDRMVSSTCLASVSASDLCLNAERIRTDRGLHGPLRDAPWMPG